MKLLLDEMISFRVAAELRARGHDVQAVKRDRPDLESVPDLTIVQVLALEARTIVTNNVKDYQPIHRLFAATGRDHAGMVFTSDTTLPRTKAAIPQWIAAFEQLVRSHPAASVLVNRVAHLP